MVSKKVKIINPSGLHLRTANILSNSILNFKASVQFEYEVNGKHGIANLKSLLSILAAGVHQGQEIEICCTGEDEEEALAAVVKVVENGLGERIE